MVTNVFKKQPKYEEDWRQVVSEVLCTLATISDKLMGEEGGAVRLDGNPGAEPITLLWHGCLVYYRKCLVYYRKSVMRFMK